MKRSYLLLPLLGLTLLGQGCFGGSTGPTGPDGGIWKTTDGGQTWVNKKALVTGAKVTASIATYSMTSLAFDPQDRNVIYAGTVANGLIVSYDGGDSWQQSKGLTATKVNDVAVDPKNKCTVYALSANKIYKTTTCMRDWAQVYYDPRTDKSFTRLVVDWYNPTNLFVGNNDGDIIHSSDAGLSWQTAKRVDGVPITSLAMDPHDSRIIYAGTQSDGIWKTNDGGTTWEQIKKQFGDEFSDARRVIKVVPDPVTANTVYDVSKYGILKSTDQGETWKALPLTSPPGTVKINSLAIDPKNNQHLIFTGVSTLQFSTDGGATWTPKKLPTTQTGGQLLIDPLEPNTVYLGTVPPPSQ